MPATRRKLERSWRLTATGLCFLIFAVCGLILTITVLPVLWLTVRSNEIRRQWAQRILSLSCAVFIRIAQILGLLEQTVTGRAHLRTPGAVLIANHPSLIDVIMLIALLPEVDCVVKPSLRYNVVTAGFVRMAGYITRAAGPELVAQCQRALAAGHRLLIFPEGTRTTPGQPLTFERGAARIALQTGAPIVPILIRFSEPTLTRSHRWYDIPRNKINVSISVGAPQSVHDYVDRYSGLPTAARALSREMQAQYQNAIEHDRSTLQERRFNGVGDERING